MEDFVIVYSFINSIFVVLLDYFNLTYYCENTCWHNTVENKVFRQIEHPHEDKYTTPDWMSRSIKLNPILIHKQYIMFIQTSVANRPT